MTTTTLKQKRQHYHRLLIALGEERYKDVIVSTRFGADSTKRLSEKQIDVLIAEAKERLARSSRKPEPKNTEKELKRWRNKCLLVMNERGITATPKDWTAVNSELAKKQYQWVMTEEQVKKGIANRKGLYAFSTLADLRKLFNQLVAIRDNERKKAKELKGLMLKN
jgi:hypothetical protein